MIASSQAMSPTPGRFTLVLAKEDFKFSCAHFTVFGADDAERLHGHNYRVAVEIAGADLDDEDLLADFVALKAEIRRLCASLDSLTLLPTESHHVEVQATEESVDIRYADRRYTLPEDDVVLLPMRNVSIEALALWFWRALAPGLASQPGVDELAVEVGETDGQSCWFRAGLTHSTTD